MTQPLPAWFSRWRIFLRERFPLVRHLTMASAFFAGNALLACRLTGTVLTWKTGAAGVLATVLIFLRLRIFDEIKDAATDRSEHGDRPLAQGLITLSEARGTAAGIAVLELAAALVAGPKAAVAWLPVLGYSLLMYREFFVGSWMRPKMELYAITHTLVAGWIGLFIATAAAGSCWIWELPAVLWVFMAGNWLVFNVFEFARKSWAPEEERPGIASYSGRWKPAGAAILTLSQGIPAAGLAAGVLGFPLLPTAAFGALTALAFLAAACYAARPSRGFAKLFRGGMSFFILAFYLLLAALSAFRGGPA